MSKNLRCRRAAVAIVAVTVAAGSAAACGGAETSEAVPRDTGAAPPLTEAAPTDSSAPGTPSSRGGSLTVYQQRAANVAPGGALNDINAAVYGDLLRTDADGQSYGVLLEAMEAVDPATWVVRLREDVVFTDDTPLDAEALKYNWEWHADPENGSIAGGSASLIASMDVIDPATLEVHLGAPDAAFDLVVATGPLNWVGSPAAMEADIDGFRREPVAAGPFVVRSSVQDGAITLERNAGYFDAELPYLDELVFQPVGEYEQRRNAVSTEEHALGEYRTASERQGYLDLGVEVIEAQQNGGDVLLLNTALAPLDDVRVRQAVVRAIDLEALNDAVFDGLEEIARGPFRPDSPFFDADAQQLEHDPATAQELIDEYASEHGTIEFDIMAPGGSESLAAEWIAQQLNTFDNVNVGIRSVDPTTRFELMTSSDFAVTKMNMIFHGGTGSFFRDSLLTDGATNFTGYSNPDVDDRFAQAGSVLDEAERAEHLIQVQRVLRDEAPLIWTYRWRRGWAATEAVGGLEVWGNSVFMPEQVYVHAD